MVNSPKSWLGVHLDEIEGTPLGRFLEASWVCASRGLHPRGADIWQYHMGSMNTAKVSLVTPRMLANLDPEEKEKELFSCWEGDPGYSWENMVTQSDEWATDLWQRVEWPEECHRNVSALSLLSGMRCSQGVWGSSPTDSSDSWCTGLGSHKRTGKRKVSA